LALASLTGGDRSIGIVRLRTKTTEFFFYDLKVCDDGALEQILRFFDIVYRLVFV
jgi:hypothetical protein